MTRPLRAVLVDDEPLALKRLEFLLARVANVETVGAADSADAGLAMVRDQRPDVLFIDIKMPGKTGLDVVEAIEPDAMPVVIFVTAYNRYATNAFDLAAVDYLLKPVEFERLRQAVERARVSVERREAVSRLGELKAVIAALREERTEGPEAEPFETEIWAPNGSTFTRIAVDKIEWAQAERDYLRLYTEPKSYLIRRKIGDFAAAINPDRFMRVHRSAVVRVDCIARVDRMGRGGLKLVLASGAQIPVGRSFTQTVRDWLRDRLPARQA